MQETVKQRLVRYLEHKKIGRNKFEISAGISQGYITNLKNAPKEQQLVKILQSAPDLNRVWLLTGEGDMLVSPDADNDSSVTVNSHNRNSTINDGDTIKQLLSLLEEKDKQINTLLNIIQKAK